MKTKKLITIVVIVSGFVILSPVYAESADDLLGVWLTEQGNSKVTIYKCGQAKDRFCGKITWLKEPNYAAGDKDAGKPKVDRENPDASRRSRPIMGLNLAWGFRFDGDKWVEGKIYNPEDGKTYSCFLEMPGPNKLKVRGYVGVSLLGKTVDWTR
ncbi:MAG: DUF2147 domain-containing protein [Leptospiraceae bacterium]|nr:DUF2147 domain-containing protein [Leptospiraceae bacterium]